MAWEHNPVGWFEIPVTDMDRAAAFYSGVFGIELEPREMGDAAVAMFPSVPGSMGTSGMLVQAEEAVPSPHGVMIYFTEPDIDGALSRVEEAGGEVVVPFTSIGRYGWTAIFADTEGNRIGLHSRR